MSEENAIRVIEGQPEVAAIEIPHEAGRDLPRTACLSFAETAHGVFAVTCLRRCSGPCHRSLRAIHGIPQLPLGCKATYAPRSGPSAFRGPPLFGDSLETSAEAL